MSAANALNPRRWRAPVWISMALALGTLLIYWPVHNFQFVNYDDSDFVTANPHVQAGLTLDGFKWAWHSEVARNWHPVTMLSHMLDCQLFKLNPGPPHLINVLLHVANTLLLFYLLNRMTGALWRSAFVAALFAWHPLHVESVAWIAERKDVLSTLFWFLTISAYVFYVREVKKTGSSTILFYSLVLIFFALGLLSKAMLVTTPFLLLLLDFWPLDRIQLPPVALERKQSSNIKSVPAKAGASKKGPIIPAQIIWEKIPLLLMTAGLSIETFLIQKHGGAMWMGANRPFPARLENALVSYVRYIGKMFWPENLAALYVRREGWEMWPVALAALVLVAISVFAVMQLRRRAWFAVGWFWYIGTLVPVIGLVQVGMQSMADRYTYVPLIGLFIIVAWGVGEVAQRWHLPNFALGTAAAIVLTVCVALTAHQVGYWSDSEALFKRMIAVTPNNFMAHYNLANFYSREHRIDDALANYEAAVEEEPNYAAAHNNYAGVLLDQKRYDDAIQHYSDAARVDAQYLYFFNLANALADSASARHDSNQFAQSVATYEKALQFNPAASEAHNNFGLTWQAQGKDPEAITEFREAARIKPDFELAHFNLANALSRSGKLDEAVAEFRIAAQLNPQRAENFNGLGVCYAMQNKMAEAAQQFLEVIRLQPDNAGANGNLANTLAAQNRIDESIPYYAAALRLNPRDFQTEFNFGLSLSRQGKRAEAETHYRKALQLNPNYTEAQRALQALLEDVKTTK